jgi:fructose-1,6-bisphosphatase-3
VTASPTPADRDPGAVTAVPQRRALYRELTRLYPDAASVLAEIATLQATLTLPKSPIHVISDVHGEHRKLKHVVNNASGSLRVLVERTFGDRLDAAERDRLLSLIYYPRETVSSLERQPGGVPPGLLPATLLRGFTLLGVLARERTREAVERVVPPHARGLFAEVLAAASADRGGEQHEAIIREYMARGAGLELLRMTARLIRNLLVAELIVAGDLGDRGPRIDRVIDYLERQPRVTITWGNHDASWMAACLGHEASIATILRISLRYRRLSQLEEGYGITLQPLERLVRRCYADDPAERFACKGDGLRDPLLMARMQKAAAILQFKLEGQLVGRHPEWGLGHRALLEAVDPRRGTVALDGHDHPLLDTFFPTVDWSDPNRLSTDEEACLARLRESFLASPTLWRQMRFVADRGHAVLRRDQVLIFHGCVPVDDGGEWIGLVVDGVERRGRDLFDALERVVQRAFRRAAGDDLDTLWYLWGGPLSPWFGKDRMTTFESFFVADPATHVETKNPYFRLINERWFCRKVLAEFSVDSPAGLIVNGHVPVRVEKGESPLKASGDALTIDGAFSEAYGDRGYTLILEATRTALALHHHFESVDAAIASCADIVPTITDLRVEDVPRRIGDTEEGDEIRERIAVLGELLAAYHARIVDKRE